MGKPEALEILPERAERGSKFAEKAGGLAVAGLAVAGLAVAGAPGESDEVVAVTAQPSSLVSE